VITMNMKLILGSFSLVMSLCVTNVLASTQDEQGFVPPTVRTVDEFGVDLSSGYVVTTVNTVSIGGGGLGLSHHITVKSNDFDMRGLYSFSDKYAGTGRYVKVV